jgi:hypothetical protein
MNGVGNWVSISVASDGWVDAAESWAYASATTITVPSGAASKYAKGDKIKITQTTVKYFYIVGVADTTLTITGGADYTLTNAAISANYYSHASSPVGFPDVFSLGAPTWFASAVNFTNQPTTNSWFMFIRGNICTVFGLALTHGTSGGTGVFRATFTTGYLPTSNDAPGNAFNLSTSVGGFGYTQSANDNRIFMAKYDGTALAGNSNYFEANVSWKF